MLLPDLPITANAITLSDRQGRQIRVTIREGVLETSALYCLKPRLLTLTICATLLANTASAGEQPGKPLSLNNARFSPDGRYILAQDEKNITVLSQNPLAVIFRVPALNATNAQFTSDGRDVLFLVSDVRNDATKGRVRFSPAHIERWSVSQRTRVSSIEVSLPECGTVAISPDGAFLAYDGLDAIFRVIDISTGSTILEKKNFGSTELHYEFGNEPQSSRTSYTYEGCLGSALIAFSPDGRFLVAGPARAYDVEAFAWDLRKKKSVRLAGAFRRIRWRSDWGPYFSPPPFAFVGDDRAIVSWPQERDPKQPLTQATVASFPSGKREMKVDITPGPLFTAADPHFVIVRPCGKLGACAVEYATGKTIASGSPAIDVFGEYYVTQALNGNLGVYGIGGGQHSSISLQAH